MSLQHVKIIDGATVAAGATNDPVAVKMEDSLNQIIIYVENKGASTNLTVNVYSSFDGILQAPLQPFTLNTTVKVGHVPVSVVPGYLIFVASNGDLENATAYDVTVSKRA